MSLVRPEHPEEEGAVTAVRESESKEVRNELFINDLLYLRHDSELLCVTTYWGRRQRFVETHKYYVSETL